MVVEIRDGSGLVWEGDDQLEWGDRDLPMQAMKDTTGDLDWIVSCDL